MTVGVRTGDTSATQRRTLRDGPPHLLITTPESLALLLSQPAWHDHWRGVQHLIVDEVHALVPTKRGADLAVSLERLAARADRDPSRLGLSATCRPADPVARFLVGPSRTCRVVEAPEPPDSPPPTLDVESLVRPDEAPHRGLTYRRLLRRIGQALVESRTTVIFANTRALTEKITHDLRRSPEIGPEAVAAHHSALDAERRRAVEAALKAGNLKAVVTSTSLELGVDIGSADLTVQVGLPGGVARCLQRVGRSGHRVGATSRGLLLAATAAELAGAVVTARAARMGRVEPLRPIAAPLDVLCQQLIGMACGGEWSADDAFDLVRKAAPMAALRRADFDACLDFLAGDLAAPAGAFEPEPGAAPRWTSPRIWKHRGRFGIRNRRVVRWFWNNVGTITSEESVRVLADGVAIGTLEGAYAERLQSGDRFVLDGRCLEFRRLEGLTVHARRRRRRTEPAAVVERSPGPLGRAGARPCLVPRGGRAACSPMAPRPSAPGSARSTSSTPTQPRSWSGCSRRRNGSARSPRRGRCSSRSRRIDEGLTYTFHAPLSRAACEALGRATCRASRPPVRPRPGADGCRPRLVDPAARGDRPPPRGDHATACAPIASPTMCWRASTAATCRRVASGTSPRPR